VRWTDESKGKRKLQKHPGSTRLLQVLFVLSALNACGIEKDENPVPADLEALESGAEDAFDLALAGDVTAVREIAVGYALTTAVFLGLFGILLWIKLGLRRYHPGAYRSVVLEGARS
jgi:hypothetical protein